MVMNEMVGRRLQIIRLAIHLKDIETIDLQISRLKSLDLSDELVEITRLLENRNFRQAIYMIKNFKEANRNAQANKKPDRRPPLGEGGKQGRKEGTPAEKAVKGGGDGKSAKSDDPKAETPSKEPATPKVTKGESETDLAKSEDIPRQRSEKRAEERVTPKSEEKKADTDSGRAAPANDESRKSLHKKEDGDAEKVTSAEPVSAKKIDIDEKPSFEPEIPTTVDTGDIGGDFFLEDMIIKEERSHLRDSGYDSTAERFEGGERVISLDEILKLSDDSLESVRDYDSPVSKRVDLSLEPKMEKKDPYDESLSTPKSENEPAPATSIDPIEEEKPAEPIYRPVYKSKIHDRPPKESRPQEDRTTSSQPSATANEDEDFDTIDDVLGSPSRKKKRKKRSEEDGEASKKSGIGIDFQSIFGKKRKKREEESPSDEKEEKRKITETAKEEESRESASENNSGHKHSFKGFSDTQTYPPISYIDQKYRNMANQFPPVDEEQFSSGLCMEAIEMREKISTKGYSEKDIEDFLEHYMRYKKEGELGKSAQIILLAAATESKFAQFLLARELFYGDILQQNYPEAFTQINTLADQNFPEAICDLGQLYEYGVGIGKDKKMALLLYEEAAEMGIERAQRHCERLKGTGLLGRFKLKK